MKKISLINLLFLMITASGCSSMNNQFECPMTPGVRCQSLDEVNQLVDEKKLGASPTSKKVLEKSINRMPNRAGGLASMRNTQSTSRPTFEETPLLNPHALSISRHPEKTIRVWIAPYEDSDGLYHEAQHVWMVSAPGFWVKPTI